MGEALRPDLSAADKPLRPSAFSPHLFEYRLIPRIVWFEFERSLYRRLGFGSAA
jgi:hypothetical protein